MNKFIKISRSIYIFTLIFLPFVVSPFSFTPYTLSKLSFLGLGILISLIFFLWSKPKTLIFPNKFIFLLILFEISSLFFNNFSIFPRYSEYPLISILIYLNIFLALNLFEKLDLEKVIFYSSFFVVIPSFVDVLASNQRVSGTLGQPNFLSFFLVLTIFSLIKIHSTFEKKKLLFIYVSMIFFLFVKTASLSSLFSLLIGLYFLKSELKFLNKKIIIISTIFIMLFLFLFGSIYLNKLKDIYNQISNPNQTIISDSFLIRKAIWNQTFRIIYLNPEKILLGFGSNSFNYYLEKYRPDELNSLSEKNLLFDKPHNYFLELLFNNGILYLSLFLYLIYISLKKGNYNFVFIPFLFFLFFNWLDLYLKTIFFLYLFLNLPNFSVVGKKFYNFSIFTITLIIFLFVADLFIKDTKSFLGDKSFIYSYSKEEIISLEIKNPLLLVMSLKFLNEDERGKIIDYLINNFPNNKAILFQLNQLF
jgi:O-antigen ligase